MTTERTPSVSKSVSLESHLLPGAVEARLVAFFAEEGLSISDHLTDRLSGKAGSQTKLRLLGLAMIENLPFKVVATFRPSSGGTSITLKATSNEGFWVGAPVIQIRTTYASQLEAFCERASNFVAQSLSRDPSA